MASPKVELERRLGRALGMHDVGPEDRTRIQKAFARAEFWDDLPPEIQELVERIEQSPAR